jgi:hypothetical protein
MINKIRPQLVCLAVLLLFISSMKAQSDHALSFFALGSLIQNDGGLAIFADHEIDFQNPNSALNIEFNYRKYTSTSISYEVGLRYGSRNLKTTAFSIEEILTDGREQTFGKVNVAYPKSLSVPFRIFLGAKPHRRTARNQSSGVFVGTTFQYNFYPPFESLPIQQEMYGAFQQRIIPYVNFGGRTKGRWVNLQIEFMIPIRKHKLEFISDENPYVINFKEFFWSIGIGHTFSK